MYRVISRKLSRPTWNDTTPKRELLLPKNGRGHESPPSRFANCCLIVVFFFALASLFASSKRGFSHLAFPSTNEAVFASVFSSTGTVPPVPSYGTSSELVAHADISGDSDSKEFEPTLQQKESRRIEHIGECPQNCKWIQTLLFGDQPSKFDVDRLRSLACVRYLPGEGFCDALLVQGLQESEHLIYTREYLEAARGFFSQVFDNLPVESEGFFVFFPSDPSDALADDEIQRLWDAKVPFLAHAIQPRTLSNFIFMPDYHFIRKEGFLESRILAQEDTKSYEERTKTVFWRGSSTSGFQGCNRELQAITPSSTVEAEELCLQSYRVVLCRKALSISWLDAKIVSPASCCAALNETLDRAGVNGQRTPEAMWSTFRGTMEIDGVANAWGNFWRMLSGSVVFRIESNYTNYYIEKQVAWEHYVPVLQNLTDLEEKTGLVMSDEPDVIAQMARIAGNARSLMLSITFETEVARVAAEISRRWAK